MDSWMEEQLHLTAWDAKFHLASNNLCHENSEYVTKESLKREESFTKATNFFQTPNRKRLKAVQENKMESIAPIFLSKSRSKQRQIM